MKDCYTGSKNRFVTQSIRKYNSINSGGEKGRFGNNVVIRLIERPYWLKKKKTAKKKTGIRKNSITRITRSVIGKTYHENKKDNTTDIFFSSWHIKTEAEENLEHICLAILMISFVKP